MNKVLALDPEAIETALDWYKVQPYIGHSKGLFLADFPRNWALEFLHRDINTDGWGFWDIEKLKEYLIQLKNSNTFISLNSNEVKLGASFINSRLIDFPLDSIL